MVSKRLPILIVAAATAFNLWALRAEVAAVQYVNDMGMHLSMVRWARGRIAGGHVPLDGWYPNLSLGSPQFHYYQTLPHVITAYASTVLDVGTAFRWSNYLLVALWPVSVYCGARLLDLPPRAAAVSAALSPLLVSVTGYGFSHDSYVFRGLGVWSQGWAMWLLPLAWGTSWRAIGRRGSPTLAAGLLAATAACHYVVGAIGFLALGAWAMACLDDVARRIGRAVVVAAGALAAMTWVIVPGVLDRQWANFAGADRPTIGYFSHSATRLLGWLARGKLLDQGRLPVITTAVAVGLLVGVIEWRRSERARALVMVWTLALLLFLGRSIPGPSAGLLPGTDDLYLRFIGGVQLASLLAAGHGLGWILPRLHHVAERLPFKTGRVGLALAAMVVVLPAYGSIAAFDRQDGAWIADQQLADAVDGTDLQSLIDEVAARGGGRIWSGSATGWGREYKIGAVPVYEELLNRDADGLGFWLRVSSLSTMVEPNFDETRRSDYDVFNVRYLIFPAERRPPVDATFLRSAGRHVLWEVPTSGYTAVVDASGVIAADRRTIGDRTLPFLRSDLPARRIFPTIDLDGGPSSPSAAAAPAEGPPGAVVSETADLENGRTRAEVSVDRAAMVVLKTTFHPRWRVTVDGVSVEPQLVAPSFVGREVPPGRHVLEFDYRSYPSYGWLLVFGALALGLLEIGPRLVHRGRAIRSSRSPRSSG
ncbi:MAG TPA: hypothetical protein VM143_03090 [Acidimicrobiales bacterium]|nr:hypothetical protein [Acidimicrobiales bacterium]